MAALAKGINPKPQDVGRWVMYTSGYVADARGVYVANCQGEHAETCVYVDFGNGPVSCPKKRLRWQDERHSYSYLVHNAAIEAAASLVKLAAQQMWDEDDLLAEFHKLKWAKPDDKLPEPLEHIKGRI